MTSSLAVKPKATLTISASTDEAAFDALASEWDDLLDHSDQRSYFLRWSWNRLWWRALRPANSNLFILACRDKAGQLVGLAPFYIKQRRTAGIPHVREINFIGTGIYAHTSECMDLVARRGYEPVVAEAMADFLGASDEWDRLSLTEIPASSVMLDGFRWAMGGEHLIEVCSRSHYVETNVSWDDYLKAIPKSMRQNVSRRIRNAFDELDCEFQLVETRDELEPAMEALVALHQARWESKGEPGSFALPGVEEFLKEAMRASLKEGRLRLWTLSINGSIAAARLGFYDNDKVYGFQGGFDPAFSNYSLGTVLIGLCIKACCDDRSISEYDFLGGEEPYKRLWTRKRRESVCLTMLRPTMRSWAYTRVEQAKRMGKTILRAAVPAPIKEIGHRMLIHKRHYSK